MRRCVVLALFALGMTPSAPAVEVTLAGHRLTDAGCTPDGRLVAGEVADLALRLHNPGEVALTGVEAWITPLTEGVETPGAWATWPDLPPGQDAEGHTPFRIRLAGTFPCGTDVRVRIDGTSDQGPFHLDLVLPTGVPAALLAPGDAGCGGCTERPRLVLEPARLVFPAVREGVEVCATVTVYNRGTGLLRLESVAVGCGLGELRMDLSGMEHEVLPGDSTRFVVGVTERAAGPDTCRVILGSPTANDTLQVVVEAVTGPDGAPLPRPPPVPPGGAHALSRRRMGPVPRGTGPRE